MERVNRKIGILFITLFILLAPASFIKGGEAQISVEEQKKIDELNHQLEKLKSKKGGKEKEKLALYKKLLQIKPGDPIYLYYIDDINNKIRRKKLSLDQTADDGTKKSKDLSVASSQVQDDVSSSESSGVAPALKSESDFRADAQKLCSTRWTNLGHVNQILYDRCLKIQATGYQTLKKLHEQYSHKQIYLDVLFPYCQTKWTKYGVADAQMIAHCLKTDVEGFRQVLKYREQYDESEVMKIAENALLQYGSWKIAAYKVKHHFK